MSSRVRRIALISASAFALVGCVKRNEVAAPSAPPPAAAPRGPEPAAAEPASAAPSTTGLRLDPGEAARFREAGMPALTDLWTVKEMEAAVRAARGLAARDLRHLPSAGTEQGTAFFRALRRATAEFHRLSSSDKVDFRNHFIDLAPLYAQAARKGSRCDKELALLIGLELEQADQFVQDRAFVAKAPPADGNGTTPAWNPRGGNVLVYFDASQDRMVANLRAHLRMLGEERFFRPEARALALGYAARHLPHLCRALQLEGIRAILVENARSESDPATLASYRSLLANPLVR